MKIITDLQTLAQCKGFNLVHFDNLTLDAVQALLNYLKDNKPLAGEYQFYLSEQINSTIYIDQIGIKTKKIEIMNANILSVEVGSTG